MIIYGVDVAATYVCIARFDSDTDAPKVKVLRAPAAGHLHNPATAHARIRALAGDANAALTRGAPDLVVMVRHTWQSMTTDPSAYRRAACHRDIVRDLLDAAVPVADVPLLTLMAWAGVKAKMGSGYLDALEHDVRKRYPDVTDPGDRALIAVTAAGAGAMALGMSTGWSVTPRRVDVLTARSSGAGVEKQVGAQWPAGVVPHL